MVTLETAKQIASLTITTLVDDNNSKSSDLLSPVALSLAKSSIVTAGNR